MRGRRWESRGALPGCASPVLAIGWAHLLSVPGSRAGPVGAAQRDRVPEMPSRRLVASALIRPIVNLPVRSLRRRHLHPYPCRPPSRLRARTEPRQGAHASCPGQGFRRPTWSYHSEPRTGPSSPRRCMRPHGHERVEGPICASEGEPHWWNRKHAQRKLASRVWWQAFTPPPGDRIPRLRFVPPVRGRTFAAAASRRAPRGSSAVTDELLPTIHTMVASSPSLLRVALLTAASPGDFYIHYLATVRTERHRRISTPVIHVEAHTLRQ